MPKPFKLEVFDGDITYRSHSVISGQTIYFDYLTLEKTTINSPIITVAKGDYAHITDFDGAVIYQGIIDDYHIQDKTMSIVLRPLLSLLDCSVVYDRTDLATGSLEAFIAGIITDKYINNTDTLQNITGLTVGTTSTTNSAKLNLKSNVHEFYDIITKALTLYGIVVTAELLPQTKKLNVSIGTVSDAVTIEAKLYNVISKNIVVANSLGGLNKIKLINKNNEAETATYYLHSDETISTTNADRITPVVERIEYVESDDFSANAEQRATAALTPQTNNNLIEIELAASNKLVDAASMKIGTTATIIDDATYSTVLTGFEKSENITKLVFGIVRLELTKKLIMQKRADSDSATYVTVAEVPATGKALSGADDTIISGTKGASGNLAKWNTDGDLVDSGVSLSGADNKAITGTSGTSGNLAAWNADGDLVDASISAGAITDPGWTAVTSFSNNWANFSSSYNAAAYKKIGNFVYLRGLIKSGTINAAAFNLPAGYRPSKDCIINTASNSAYGQIYVNGATSPAGNVIVQVGSNTWASLEGIRISVD